MGNTAVTVAMVDKGDEKSIPSPWRIIKGVILREAGHWRIATLT